MDLINHSMQKNNHFKDVTLLITHYNRSSSLERLLKCFNELNCSFEEIVVSDDGSRSEHLDKIKGIQSEYGFKLVTTPANKGLGNNINKGQDAVNTPYTVYIQEDFVPTELFPEKLSDAVQFMNDDPELDTVRFYAYFKYPFLQPFKSGFARMIFSASPLYTGYRKFYYYSDHPHLRRSNFFEKFGRYKEGLKVEKTEYKMMMSFLKAKGQSLFYTDFQRLFTQENSSLEPSTVKRNFWRESSNPLIILMKHTYRYIKFNIDLHL